MNSKLKHCSKESSHLLVLFSPYFVCMLTVADKKIIEKINCVIKEKRSSVEKTGVRSHSTKRETEVSQNKDCCSSSRQSGPCTV